MGEQRRRREAAYALGLWPGGRARCPQCFGTRVVCEPAPDNARGGGFYGRELAICGACGIAWEPIDEALIWDRDDPTGSFSEPCDNCAFRPGSHEQADTEAWKIKMAALREGGIFYCHKGLRLVPGSEDGFAYPTKTVVALGHETKVHDVGKMRVCCGYLKAARKWWRFTETTDGDSGH